MPARHILEHVKNLSIVRPAENSERSGPAYLVKVLNIR